MESSDEAETQTQVCLMLEPMFLFMELKWSPSKHYYWHKWTLLRNYSFKTLVTFSSPLIYTDLMHFVISLQTWRGPWGKSWP